MATAPPLPAASLSAELIALPAPAPVETEVEHDEGAPAWHADLRFFLAAYAGFLLLFMLILA